VTFGTQIASRLRAMRRAQRAPQEVVAQALSTSVSAISRLERGFRGLRVDHLVAWAGALGYRVDVVFWTPTLPEERWDPENLERAMGLDDEAARVLAEVASGVGHMPPAARQALIRKVRLWKDSAKPQSAEPAAPSA
jgi:transcriptional regulator with XRE-family HTH domain